jgi:NAD(P)H-dependent FMN reductase
MSYSPSISTAVQETEPEILIPEAAAGGAVEGLLGAIRQEGFDAGYRRAASDLLAEFLLISEEYLHDLPEPDPNLRALLRSFEEQLARFARTRMELDGFVEGGLGI